MLANEVYAVLNAASTEVHNAVQQLTAINHQLGSAYQSVLMVAQSSVDPVGAPQIQAMIGLLEQAIQMGALANDQITRHMPRI